MPKMRVHEVAKLLNKSSKEVITALKQQGVEVQSHMSTVTEENVSKIKASFRQAEQKKTQEVSASRMQETSGRSGNEPEKPKEEGRQQEMSRRHSAESSNRNERRSQSGNDGVERSVRTDRNEGSRNRRTNDDNRDAGTRGDGRGDGGRTGSRNSDGNRNHNTRSDARGENRNTRNTDGTRNDNRGENRNVRNADGTRSDNRGENRSYRNSDGTRNDNRSSRNSDGSRNDSRGENRGSRSNDSSRNGDTRYNNRNNDGSRSYSNRNSDGNRYGNRSDSGRSGDGKRYNRNSEGGRNYNNRNNEDNRSYGSRGDGSRNSDTRYNNRNNDGSRSYSNRNNDDNRSYNRGDGGRSGSADSGRGNDTNRRNRSKSMTGGDTPINAKESRSGSSRHDINREHSRENQNRSGENRDSRGGKNSRRNNNNNSRNNDYNNNNRKQQKNKTKQPIVKPPKKEEPKEEVIRNITLPDPVSLKELAEACKVTPAVIIKKLFLAGQMVTINTEFSFEDAADIALEYNCIAEEEVQVDVIEELLKEEEEEESTLVGRPPVVCVMGHVDHGKTSLLDAIRSTHVTEGEAGGITQHIGAYVVNINDEKITFLDTPGHEAFTSMRLRGAQATDIAVLVVAADDGVMPQTIEAINHAKAAEVEVIVAVNKIDKEGANVERVKQELTEYGLIAEDWGGSTVFVPVSAKTGEGIQDLLEMISLTAEVLELKANPNRKARGLVIEAKLDKGRGPVATVLIQKGTLHVGDNVNIGHTFGRIRAMIDDKGNRVKTAGPSVPVEILGLNDVPFSGEVMMAHDSEKEARTTAEAFVAYSREKMLEDTKSKLSLDDLFDQIQAGNVKELNLVVKADVQGSVEAVRQSLMKLSNDEVVIKVIHGGVGAINESDVTLASASNAIIIGFNVRPDATAKSVAEREKVDMRLYRVIYNAIEDIEAAIKGMLDPIFKEKVIGHLDVRQIYKASGVGTIAGCYVVDGMISRTAQVRIVRDGIVIYEGLLASLKRFKDDVKEVKSGFECGLVFEKFNDVKEGDQVEAFVMEEIPR